MSDSGCISYVVSRIHISRATLDCLEGSYKTEDGRGYERSEFLRKHNIDTFLICPKEEEHTVEAEHSKIHMTIRNSNTDNLFGSINNMSSVRISWFLKAQTWYHTSDDNDMSDNHNSNDQLYFDGSNNEL